MLKEINHDINWEKKKDKNACLVLQGGQISVKKIAKNAKLEYALNGHTFYLERNVVKDGNTDTKASKIQADYVNYSKDGNVNFVLWDVTLEKVIDTFNVEETAEGAMVIYRE